MRPRSQGIGKLDRMRTAAVIAAGAWRNHRKGRSAREVLIADEHAAQRLEDKID